MVIFPIKKGCVVSIYLTSFVSSSTVVHNSSYMVLISFMLWLSYLIYPHISYAIVAWGSAYKTHINKLQVKHNHLAKAVFFQVLYCRNTLSTLYLLNFLDFPTVNNVYQFKVLKFIQDWHKQIFPPIFKTLLIMPIIIIIIIIIN